MPERDEQAIKETISCRKFEASLDSAWVSQPTYQGRDYGTDFTVTAFDKNGDYARKFEAQVKYLADDPNLDDYLERFFNWYNFPQISSIYNNVFIGKIRLAKKKIETYVKNPFELLLVTANNKQLLFLWFNDYYNFFYRWFGDNNNVESTVIYLNGLRSLRKIKTDVDNEMESIHFPWHNIFSGYETLTVNDIDANQKEWLRDWCIPNTTDGISNIGFSSYFFSLNNEKLVREKFDVVGFWGFLVQYEQENRFIFSLFSNFVGQLKPTSEMISWAKEVIFNWKDLQKLGCAFQILSNSEDSTVIDSIFNFLSTKTKKGIYWNVLVIKSSSDIKAADSRLELETFISYAQFLRKSVENHKNILGQEILFEEFSQFDYSVSFPNIYCYGMSELIRKNLIIKESSSYKTLLDAADPYIKNGIKLKDVIYEMSNAWQRIHFHSKYE